MKTLSGKVSTRIEHSKKDGGFEFQLPPPSAERFNLLIYPYEIEYTHLAAKKQEISIVLPGDRKMEFEEVVRSMHPKGKLKLWLTIEEFAMGVDESDSSSGVITRVREAAIPFLSSARPSFDVSYQPGASLTKTQWFIVTDKKGE